MFKRVIVSDTGGSKDLILNFGIQNSSVVSPPYKSIFKDDVIGISNKDQPEYVKILSIEMIKAINDGKNINIPMIQKFIIRQYLSSHYIYSSYNFIFNWLNNNGDVHSIRNIIRWNFK
jgi:hypothetical protein